MAARGQLLSWVQTQADSTRQEGASHIAVAETSRKFSPKAMSTSASKWQRLALRVSLKYKCSKVRKILNLVKCSWLS